MASDAIAATLALVSVSASLPLYLYGAWVIIDAEIVTWDVLVRHLSFIVPGLVLTTAPVVLWMLPRLLEIFRGIPVFHAILGLHAYALLTFALTGIVRIFQAKRNHDLYENPDQDVALSDLHENADAWRARLRIGVFGYLLLWILAYVVGVAYYVLQYVV